MDDRRWKDERKGGELILRNLSLMLPLTHTLSLALSLSGLSIPLSVALCHQLRNLDRGPQAGLG